MTPTTPPSRVMPLYFMVVILLVGIIGFIVYIASDSTKKDKLGAESRVKQSGIQSANASREVNKVAIIDNTDSPSFGSSADRTKVTVVEFFDFQCPYSKVSSPVVQQLLSRYKGQPVRFEFRNLPISDKHPYAVSAAHASLCANEQNKFIPFYDLTFQRQSEITADSMYIFARDLGLDMGSFAQCMSKGSYKEQIQKDYSDGLALNIKGTPTWFINGQFFEGALSSEAMATIIDNMLGIK